MTKPDQYHDCGHRLRITDKRRREPKTNGDSSSSALFIPLKAEYYIAFERGEKTVEYRPYGPRWNERTCDIGRPVTLSYGYGTQRRLRGRVVKFEKSREPLKTLAWLKCYGHRTGDAACITITLDGMNA